MTTDDEAHIPEEMKQHGMDAMHVQEPKEESERTKSCCGPLTRYPLLAVVSFAIIGIGVGLGLSFWAPSDPETKEKTIKWIGLIGDLFIRALKCVILPLVFINVIISVVDMMSVGRAGSIGWKTVLMYTCTTLIASLLGIISTLSFKPLFTQGTFADQVPATVRLGCNMAGQYLTELGDGNAACLAGTEANETDSLFFIEDVSKTFVRAAGGISSTISLSDTVYDGVFTKLVADNLAGAFTDANFAAVVFFAIVFGVALSNVLFHKEKTGDTASHVMPFFMELDKCFLTIINWIILITPFAVLSLIAAAIGSQTDLVNSFANVGYLVLACCMGFFLQFAIVHVCIFYAVTRWNPFTYLKCLAPAQTMAFACASSAATIPMTLKSVRSTGRVPESILKFVVPLGATVNMDGSAIYFPCACIWLAVLNGVNVNIAHYILLVVIATIGSAGTAPVPASGLVLIITAYNTVFSTTGVPEGFSYVVAIDWFLDRLITVTNVTGDAMVCGMISKLCPVTDDDESADLEKTETEKADPAEVDSSSE